MNRTLHLAAVALALVALTLTTSAQAQRRGGGRGFGRFGGGGVGPVQLVQTAQVQAELKVNDSQQQQLDAINQELRDARREVFQQGAAGDREANLAKMQKATAQAEAKVNKVLDEAQQKRLQQIWIQVAGTAALGNTKVAAELKLTDQQKGELQQIAAANREQLQALFQDTQGTSRAQRMEKMQALSQQTDQKRLAVLTADQKKQFEAMQGAPFEFDRTQLFRGGRGGRRGGRRGTAQDEA